MTGGKQFGHRERGKVQKIERVWSGRREQRTGKQTDKLTNRRSNDFAMTPIFSLVKRKRLLLR